MALPSLPAASSGPFPLGQGAPFHPHPCCGNAVGELVSSSVSALPPGWTSVCCTVGRWTLQIHLVALSLVLPLAAFAPGWTLPMDPRPDSLLAVSVLSPATILLLCPQCSAPICGALSVLESPSLLSDRVFLLLYSFMT